MSNVVHIYLPIIFFISNIFVTHRCQTSSLSRCLVDCKLLYVKDTIIIEQIAIIATGYDRMKKQHKNRNSAEVAFFHLLRSHVCCLLNAMMSVS
jgi:hypothetical protein